MKSGKTHLSYVTALLLTLAAGLLIARPLQAAAWINFNDIVRELTEDEQGTGSVDLDIVFQFNAHLLTPQAKKQLDELARAISQPLLQKTRLVIAGHTDSIGDAAYNKDLSLKRARSVRDYLVEHHKVDPSRLAVEGWGEERPKNPHNPRDRINRRVEVRNLTPVDKPAGNQDGMDNSSAAAGTPKDGSIPKPASDAPPVSQGQKGDSPRRSLDDFSPAGKGAGDQPDGRTEVNTDRSSPTQKDETPVEEAWDPFGSSDQPASDASHGADSQVDKGGALGERDDFSVGRGDEDPERDASVPQRDNPPPSDDGIGQW